MRTSSTRSNWSGPTSRDLWPACLAKRNLAQLIALARTRLKRMQYRPALLDGFLASTRLDLTPFGNPTLKDC
jgi:hypothetical protein